jgi:hypothetical protein
METESGLMRPDPFAFCGRTLAEEKIMRRFLLGALLSVPLLASPLWARPPEHGEHHSSSHWSHGGYYHGGYRPYYYGWNRPYYYGWWNRGYGYSAYSWYMAPYYGSSVYVAPSYGTTSQYSTTPQFDANALVNAWYRHYLGRDMDAGAQGWIDHLQNGRDPTWVLSAILGSDEYYQRSGSTPRGFLDHLYQDVAGRRLSSSEVALQAFNSSARMGIAYDLLQRNPQAVMIQ